MQYNLTSRGGGEEKENIPSGESIISMPSEDISYGGNSGTKYFFKCMTANSFSSFSPFKKPVLKIKVFFAFLGGCLYIT